QGCLRWPRFIPNAWAKGHATKLRLTEVPTRIASDLSKTLLKCSLGARQPTDRDCRLPSRLPPSLDVYDVLASSLARDGCSMTVRQSQSASSQKTSNDKFVSIAPRSVGRSDQQVRSPLLQPLQTSSHDPQVHRWIPIILSGLLKIFLNIFRRLATSTSQITQSPVEERFGLLQCLFLLAVRAPPFSDDRC